MPNIDVIESSKFIRACKLGAIIAGCITGTFAAQAALGKAGVPTLVFSNQMSEQLSPVLKRLDGIYVLQAQAEVDARIRLERADQIKIFEFKQRLEETRRAGQTVPTDSMEHLQRLEGEAHDNSNKLQDAIKRLK